MNQTIFEFLGANEVWGKVTDLLLVGSILVLSLFVIMGAYQLFKRKSLKKVDREILGMVPSLVLMLAVYLIFGKLLVVNYRPIPVDGVMEVSFPSSHVMAVTTILLMTTLALPKYVSNKKIRIIATVMMAIIIVLVAFGRVASGMHWATDVIGALIFSVIFVALYKFIISRKGKNE